MNFTGHIVIAQAELSESEQPFHNPGTRAVTRDGRGFRYVQAGSANLVAGSLIQSPATVADHVDLVAANNQAVGSKTLTVTLANTAVSADQYRGGIAIISTTPGGGYRYLIKGHPAANANSSLTLTLEDGLVEAVNATSRVDLVANPYKGVIVNPTVKSGAPVGVSVFPITANHYGWIQTSGPAPVLIEGTPAVGTAVSPSANVAGAVSVAVVGDQAANTATTVPVVGNMLETGVDGKWKAVKLSIE